MKKGFVPYIAIILLASALLGGCSSSTQVNNTPTKTTGPWVLQTQSPTIPIILVDSLHDTLTGVFDTASQRVVGAVFTSSAGGTSDIFLDDSDRPERAVLGQYEMFFANYTDTSVDVAITDTAGDIGVQTNLNVREAFSMDSVHTTLISRTMKKGAVPQGLTLSQITEYINSVIDGVALTQCMIAAITTIELIGTDGGAIAWNPGAFESYVPCAWSIWKYFVGLASSPETANPNTPQGVGQSWAAGQGKDQYISNKPSVATWSISGPQISCDGAMQSLGSYSITSGPSTYPAGTPPAGTDGISSVNLANPGDMYVAACNVLTIGVTLNPVNANGILFVKFSGSFSEQGDTWNTTGAARY